MSGYRPASCFSACESLLRRLERKAERILPWTKRCVLAKTIRTHIQININNRTSFFCHLHRSRAHVQLFGFWRIEFRRLMIRVTFSWSSNSCDLHFIPYIFRSAGNVLCFWLIKVLKLFLAISKSKSVKAHLLQQYINEHIIYHIWIPTLENTKRKLWADEQKRTEHFWT